MVPIDLTEFERGAPFSGDVEAALATLRERLTRLQLAQMVHRRRMIILFEGWDGSGKKATLKALMGALDPCHASVQCHELDILQHDERHWLARYWSELPAAGHTSIFYRSWYAHMLMARVMGDATPKELERATDEINEFESQQHDHGTLVVKLFFHVTKETQTARLQAQRDDPWQRWQLHPDRTELSERRDDFIEALEHGFEATNTRWAPWRIIDGNDLDAGKIAALTVLADAMQKALPSAPPVEGENVVSFRSKRQA